MSILRVILLSKQFSCILLFFSSFSWILAFKFFFNLIAGTWINLPYSVPAVRRSIYGTNTRVQKQCIFHALGESKKTACRCTMHWTTRHMKIRILLKSNVLTEEYFYLFGTMHHFWLTTDWIYMNISPPTIQTCRYEAWFTWWIHWRIGWRRMKRIFSAGSWFWYLRPTL